MHTHALHLPANVNMPILLLDQIPHMLFISLQQMLNILLKFIEGVGVQAVYGRKRGETDKINYSNHNVQVATSTSSFLFRASTS